MSVTFEHRCPATAPRRDDKGRTVATIESCRSTQTWEVSGTNTCPECGCVPDAEWRHAMAGKLGIEPDAAEEKAAKEKAADVDDGQVECPECGGLTLVTPGAKSFTCSQCGAKLSIDAVKKKGA